MFLASTLEPDLARNGDPLSKLLLAMKARPLIGADILYTCKTKGTVQVLTQIFNRKQICLQIENKVEKLPMVSRKVPGCEVWKPV